MSSTNRNYMKKLIHGLVLTMFAFACWFAWALLTLTGSPILTTRLGQLPAFTRMCVGMRPVLLALPIMAAIYCVWVWSRKPDKVPSWIGFFAAAMGVLVLVAVPTMLAAYLPLLAAVNHLAAK
jgi:hypothetical protein